MSAIVVYKSKYGSTENYAKWIAKELECEAVDVKNVKINELEKYDKIVYGGGLYAEMIAGITIISKNLDKLKDKKIAVFTTGLTPLDCREYYDNMVAPKNFKGGVPQNVKIFNFMGKMILEELTPVHKAAIVTLKKIMSAKKNPTEMEKLLIDLCDNSGDFSDKNAIKELVEYVCAD